MSPTLAGLMQSWPLTLDRLLIHAATWHPDRTLASATKKGVILRSYHEVHERARRTSSALRGVGIVEGDRVATLGMNSISHVEAWFGIVGIGAVCHTLNPRLSSSQLAHIVHHAGDRLLFVDRRFLAVAAAVAAACPTLERVVVFDEDDDRGTDNFEEFIAAADTEVAWGEFSEEAAAGLCYTSGTTGTPKGVLYSHRSNFLHTLITIQPDAFNLSTNDTILPIVPMYHANAWGLTYSAPAVGARLVMPGVEVGGAAIANLIDDEAVTIAFAVPTVWLGLLEHLKAATRKLPSLRRVVVGGAACSERLVRDFADLGIDAIPAWGMTELSPVGTVNSATPETTRLGANDAIAARAKQGRALCGIDLKLVAPSGAPVPRDGQTHGHLRVRGPGVARAYFRHETPLPLDEEGYFDTGDIATVEPTGMMRIADRARDMIKSGGEWISPTELEMVALSHPALTGAGVIGIPDIKWDERPVMFVSKAPEAEVDQAELFALLTDNFPRWMLPDRIVVVERLPLGATGKVDKNALRQLAKTLDTSII